MLFRSAALLALARQAEAHRDLMITGRTHNVPAQPTTFGKRLAMFGQELLVAFTRLEELLARWTENYVMHSQRVAHALGTGASVPAESPAGTPQDKLTLATAHGPRIELF